MPCVSIGLPVYNGEQYIEDTLKSILSQTFSDFELIISDNASIDRTNDICMKYVSMDTRIKYYRNEKNLGTGPNFNNCFKLSSGKYFIWAMHDDLHASDFLEQCVKALESDSTAVLCYTSGYNINENGIIFRKLHSRNMLEKNDPAERFRDLLTGNPLNELYGLIRSEVLRKTKLLKSYSLSDRVLIAELVLRGRFIKIPDALFFSRIHPKHATAVYSDRYIRTILFDTSKTSKYIFPHWRTVFEYLVITSKVPLKLNQRVSCYITIVNWCIEYINYLKWDLTRAIRLLFK